MPRGRRASTSNAAKRAASSRDAGDRCGLCRKTGPLIRTDCCHRWICDDEASYQLFSYARNSCAHNHTRFTLCAFHFNEGHRGAWQSCAECRTQFKPEMYVYYGTNEYNFEVLPDPPRFAPTLCSTCGTRIVLGDGGYSTKGKEYFCASCSDTMMRAIINPKRRPRTRGK